MKTKSIEFGEEDIGRDEGEHIGKLYLPLIVIGIVLLLIWSGLVRARRELWLWFTMPTVCSWCQTTQRGLPFMLPGCVATHTVCKECKKKTLAGTWRPSASVKRQIEARIKLFHSGK